MVHSASPQESSNVRDEERYCHSCYSHVRTCEPHTPSTLLTLPRGSGAGRARETKARADELISKTKRPFARSTSYSSSPSEPQTRETEVANEAEDTMWLTRRGGLYGFTRVLYTTANS